MPKVVRIQATEIGADVDLVSLYHTEVSGSNLISSSLTADDLATGFLINVPDSVNEFYLRAENGACFDKTGSASVTPYSPNTRYFTVNSDGDGTVEVSLPTPAGPTSGSITQSVNFVNHSFFVIDAASVYPIQFDGWHDKPSGSAGATLLSTDYNLSITLNTFTGSDDFYAYFS